MSLILIGWLFTSGVLAHNAEEALYLPAWCARAGRWYKPIPAREFRLAAAVLSAIFVGITLASSLTRSGSPAAYMMDGYVLAMVLNAFVPHPVATLLMRRYMPGLRQRSCSIFHSGPALCVVLLQNTTSHCKHFSGLDHW